MDLNNLKMKNNPPSPVQNYWNCTFQCEYVLSTAMVQQFQYIFVKVYNHMKKQQKLEN